MNSLVDSTSNSDVHSDADKKQKVSIAYVTRRKNFSAGHRMHNPNLDEEANKALFGKCNNPNGHGHNYSLEVTVRGPVNSTTGSVMSQSELRDIIAIVVEPMDHRRLDQDLDYFGASDLVATSENITKYIWNKLSKLLPSSVKMVNLRLHETDKNYIDYKGDLEDLYADPMTCSSS